MAGKRVRALFPFCRLAIAMICIVSPLPVRAETDAALERAARQSG